MKSNYQTMSKEEEVLTSTEENYNEYSTSDDEDELEDFEIWVTYVLAYKKLKSLVIKGDIDAVRHFIADFNHNHKTPLMKGMDRNSDGVATPDMIAISLQHAHYTIADYFMAESGYDINYVSSTWKHLFTFLFNSQPIKQIIPTIGWLTQKGYRFTEREGSILPLPALFKGLCNGYERTLVIEHRETELLATKHMTKEYLHFILYMLDITENMYYETYKKMKYETISMAIQEKPSFSFHTSCNALQSYSLTHLLEKRKYDFDTVKQSDSLCHLLHLLKTDVMGKIDFIARFHVTSIKLAYPWPEHYNIIDPLLKRVEKEIDNYNKMTFEELTSEHSLPGTSFVLATVGEQVHKKLRCK